MKYTLDTNVLLYYVRDRNTRKFIDEEFDPFNDSNESIISIVSIGEIYSLAAKNKWGEQKMRIIEHLINNVIIVEVRYRDLINAYVEIETYSNRTNERRKYSGSAVKMGKNDLWIAATALVTGSKLITSDNDFDHLNSEFFRVLKYAKQK